jgi:EF hand
MRSLALVVVLAAATPATAQPRGAVSAIQLSDARVTAGTPVTMTISGTNPCGAVFIDQQDGTAVTYPITTVPTTIKYTYTKPGTYRIVTRGMGNCDGEASTTITVLPAPTPPPPPPPPRSPEPRQPVPSDMRFKEMDRDGDGVITRAEWQGSDQSFRENDSNNDGVLSGDEVRSRGPRRPTGQTIVVDATRQWVDTGLVVRRGDLVLFDASGRAQLSSIAGDVFGPGGAPPNRRAPEAPLPQQPAGALIGRVGNSSPFVIGTRSSIVAPAAGRLFLGINDDYLPDNKGEYRVIVDIDR